MCRSTKAKKAKKKYIKKLSLTPKTRDLMILKAFKREANTSEKVIPDKKIYSRKSKHKFSFK